MIDWNRAASSGEPAPGVAEAVVAGLRLADGRRGSGGEDVRTRIRQDAARLFGWQHPDRVVFTSGATFGLNQAVRDLPRGARVFAPALEHNASLRPLHARAEDGAITLEVLPFGGDGRVSVEEVARRLDAHASDAPVWLFLSLASNLLGTLQPVDALAALCAERGVALVLDLSQGGGQVPVRLSDWKPRYAVVPGHKGLHGPPGVGLLFVAPEAEPDPLVRGGTGVQGERLTMPTELPIALEAGTPNLPGILGLGAALRWRLDSGLPDLAPVRARLARLEERLRGLPGVQPLPSLPVAWDARLPVLALASAEVPPALLAAYLEQQGIRTRAGMMCAALAPAAAGVDGTGGVLRLSPPVDAPEADFVRVGDALEEAFTALAPPPA